MRLERLTWPQVQARLQAGWRRVLVPLGATEQHGPHLPLGTDTVLATELAVRVARGLGRTLVAPVVPVGSSAEHGDFPGTLSVSHEALAGVLLELCEWLHDHGFGRVVVFSAHGGNGRALQLLAERARPGTVVLTELPQLPGHHDRHAGRDETSMMLRVDPKSVDRRAAQPGYQGPLDGPAWAVLTSAGVRALTANGVLGDPRRATERRGEALLREQAQTMVALLQPLIDA